MTTWTIEFYEDANGKRPVEAWMDGLGDVHIGALAAAIEEVLAKRGLDLASTPWLKALGEACVSSEFGRMRPRSGRCTRILERNLRPSRRNCCFGCSSTSMGRR